MAAKTIGDVRNLLSKPKLAEGFSAGFAEVYFSQAMGALPKAEIDLLVFKLLVDLEIISASGSIFSIARTLNITPAKARNLLFQFQLRHVDDLSGDEMVTAALTGAAYSVDGKRLSLGIESPLARAIIDSRLKERGIFADLSMSGEILRIPLTHLDKIIDLLMTEEKARELEASLKEQGYLPEDSFAGFLKKYGTKVGLEAAGEAGKQGVCQLISALGEFLAGGSLSAVASFVSSVS